MVEAAIEHKRTEQDSARQYRPDIPGADAKDIEWYFRSGGHGVFSSSTFGAQLDRAWVFAFGCDPCEQCGGTGFVPSDPKLRNPVKRKRASARRNELLELLNAHGADHGLSAVDVAKLERELPPALADMKCAQCRGMGRLARQRWRSRGRITVRSTGSSVKRSSGGPSVNVGEVNLAKLARMGKLLAALHDVSVVSVEAFGAWFSQERPTRSLIGVYHLTPAGKKLLRKNKLHLAPVQLLRNELDAEQKRSEPNRKALFESAEQQARDIMEQASHDWRKVAQRTSGPSRELLAILGRGAA